MNPLIVRSCCRTGRPPKALASWSKRWICQSGSTRNKHTTATASADAPLKKPYYVTTPIFYVNADPHVGHLYTMVLADILKRWQVLKGENAILCTGTDEHGIKIQQAAARAGYPPKEFCDTVSETFKALAKQAEISNTHFVRTTDSDHKEAVQYFWYLLKERGYIYESKHEGWYCVSDETYYPESTIEKRLDPFTGKTFMASQETGKEVEWTSERNYHFRLSAMKNRLLQFYESRPDFVLPATRMADVVKAVSEGLEDLSVSRPIERLTWGIRVPDDETQTIYVWLDALVNYITKAGYPWPPGQESAGGWPANVQVIGKDIVRFHCIYWPAFLLALDLEPPKQILTHAHWTLGHQKMAKSTGNVVNPFFAIERFGIDTLRFYLAHDGGIANDSSYGNHLIVEKYKTCLQGGLGNLVSRITRSKYWSVSKAVESATAGTLRGPDPTTVEQIAKLKKVRGQANAKMKELSPGAALQAIMEMVYETNKYFSINTPWIGAKDGIDLELQRVDRTIYYAAEAVRIVAILLQPFMPSKAAEILDVLGVDVSRRTYFHADIGADDCYGVPKIPVGDGPWNSVFPPLPVET